VEFGQDVPHDPQYSLEAQDECFMRLPPEGAMSDEELAELRQCMIAKIAAKVIYACASLGKAALSQRVIEVVAKVPRHEFVPLEIRPYAYADSPLPIGFGKSISRRITQASAYRRHMAIRVECYAGYRGEQEPLAFWFGERRVAVRGIVDRWFAPTQRWFKVEADDGQMYVLRLDEATGDWELAALTRGAGY